MQRAGLCEDAFFYLFLNVLDDFDTTHQEAGLVRALPQLGSKARGAAGRAGAQHGPFEDQDFLTAKGKLQRRAAACRASADDDDVS